MKYTNVNISNNNGYLYPYVVSLDESATPMVSGESLSYFKIDSEKIAVFCPGSINNINRNVNNFIKTTWSDPITLSLTNYKKSTLRIYWPTDSVDVYNRTKYVFTASIHISGVEIVLASRIVSRIEDALACPNGVQRFGNNEYVEYTDFDIIDPSSIIYDDGWDSFRKNVCGEPQDSNSEGSQIGFSLIPVEQSTDSRDEWIMRVGYVGSQNSINVSGPDNNLSLNLQFDINSDSYSGTPMIVCTANFNPIYDNDLVLYLKETYGLISPAVRYELIVSKDRLLAVAATNYHLDILQKQSPLTTENHYSINSFMFNDWTEYVPGMIIYGTINIYDLSFYDEGTSVDDMDELFSIKSNPLPITQKEFRFLTTNNNNHKKYDLSQLDMDTYNITIPNITNKTVISYDNISDSKSNIIQPVFFKTFDLESIVVHPAVTENISLNLDIYKSKVETFQLQLEGVLFPEIGRLSSGVIFKIQGNRLPKEQMDGNYYILDQTGTMVTTGKYTYDM